MPRPTDEQITAYFDQVSALIRDHGWMVQGVFASVDDDDADEFVPFCYTIGLAAKGYPELLVIGFPHEFATGVLNTIATWTVERAAAYAHGSVLHSTGTGGAPWRGDLKIRGPVDDVAGACPAHMARNFYAWSGAADPEALRVLQVDWPDPDGRYADQAGEGGACSPQLPLLEPVA